MKSSGNTSSKVNPDSKLAKRCRIKALVEETIKKIL